MAKMEETSSFFFSTKNILPARSPNLSELGDKNRMHLFVLYELQEELNSNLVLLFTNKFKNSEIPTLMMCFTFIVEYNMK